MNVLGFAPSVVGLLPHIGPLEGLMLLALGLLLFGRRLPEVGRSLGKGIVEFKRGLRDISEDIEEESSRPPPKPTAEARGSQALPGTQPHQPAPWPQEQPTAEREERAE